MTKRAPDLRQSACRSVVVDARRARIAEPLDDHERRQDGGNLVAIAAQLAARAVVRAVREALAGARTARAVLRQRGRARRRTLDATAPARDHRHGARLAIDRGDE